MQGTWRRPSNAAVHSSDVENGIAVCAQKHPRGEPTDVSSPLSVLSTLRREAESLLEQSLAVGAGEVRDVAVQE